MKDQLLKDKIKNSVVKEEIARSELSLLLPLCMQRSSAAESVYMCERVYLPFLFVEKHCMLSFEKTDIGDKLMSVIRL